MSAVDGEDVDTTISTIDRSGHRMTTQVHPLSSDRCPDAVDLFLSNPSTRGCWCQHPRWPVKTTHAGWGEGNRRRFEAQAAGDNPPGGLLAYDDSGTTVGWCSAGPRTRYAKLLRSPLTGT
jgi:hypothetical protein